MSEYMYLIAKAERASRKPEQAAYATGGLFATGGAASRVLRGRAANREQTIAGFNQKVSGRYNAAGNKFQRKASLRLAEGERDQELLMGAARNAAKRGRQHVDMTDTGHPLPGGNKNWRAQQSYNSAAGGYASRARAAMPQARAVAEKDQQAAGRAFRMSTKYGDTAQQHLKTASTHALRGKKGFTIGAVGAAAGGGLGLALTGQRRSIERRNR